MDSTADFWNGIAQWFGYETWEWGSAGEWFAAIATAGALIAAIVTFRQARYFEARRQADDYSTWTQGEPFGGGDQGRELMIAAENHGEKPIRRPIAYVPRADVPNGWYVFRMSSGGEVQAGQRVARAIRLVYDHDAGPGVVIQFRDSQNREWTRYAESGKYPSYLAKRLLMRRMRHIEFADHLVRELDADSFFAAAR